MPFFNSALHVGQAQLGLILSIQLVGSVAMTSVAGLLTDRFGDRAVVFWSGAVMRLALIAASLVENFAWLIVWLLIYGIGYAAVTPAGSHAIIFFFKQGRPRSRDGRAPVRRADGGRRRLAACCRHRGALPVPRRARGRPVCSRLLACSIASLLYREPHELAGERVSMRAMLVDMLTIARDARLILLTLTSMILICAQFALMGFLTLTFVHTPRMRCGLPLGSLRWRSSRRSPAGSRGDGSAIDLFGGSRTLPLALVCAARRARRIRRRVDRPRQRRCGSPAWSRSRSDSRPKDGSA